MHDAACRGPPHWSNPRDVASLSLGSPSSRGSFTSASAVLSRAQQRELLQRWREGNTAARQRTVTDCWARVTGGSSLCLSPLFLPPRSNPPRNSRYGARPTNGRPRAAPRRGLAGVGAAPSHDGHSFCRASAASSITALCSPAAAATAAVCSPGLKDVCHPASPRRRARANRRGMRPLPGIHRPRPGIPAL